MGGGWVARFKCLQNEFAGGRPAARRQVRKPREKSSLVKTWWGSDPGQLPLGGRGEGFGKSSEEEAGAGLDAGHDVGTKTRMAATFLAWRRLEWSWGEMTSRKQR